MDDSLTALAVKHIISKRFASGGLVTEEAPSIEDSGKITEEDLEGFYAAVKEQTNIPKKQAKAYRETPDAKIPDYIRAELQRIERSLVREPYELRAELKEKRGIMHSQKPKVQASPYDPDPAQTPSETYVKLIRSALKEYRK